MVAVRLHVVAFLLWIICVMSKPCGDTVGYGMARVPCSCGDEVSTSTRLQPDDPVVNTVCETAIGLAIIVDYVVLDCQGLKIVGNRAIASHGIYVSDLLEAIVIQNCVVQNFINGIVLDGERIETFMNARVSHNTVLDSVNHGVLSESNFNTFTRNIVQNSGGTGMLIRGLGGNFLYENRISNSGGDGIHIFGNNNRIQSTKIQCSGQRGLVLVGNYNSIQWNVIAMSSYEGIMAIGSYNVLEWNGVLTPVVVGSDGIVIIGDRNILSWTEATNFGDNGLVMDGIGNKKQRRVVPPPGLRNLIQCPSLDEPVPGKEPWAWEPVEKLEELRVSYEPGYATMPFPEEQIGPGPQGPGGPGGGPGGPGRGPKGPPFEGPPYPYSYDQRDTQQYTNTSTDQESAYIDNAANDRYSYSKDDDDGRSYSREDDTERYRATEDPEENVDIIEHQQYLNKEKENMIDKIGIRDVGRASLASLLGRTSLTGRSNFPPNSVSQALSMSAGGSAGRGSAISGSGLSYGATAAGRGGAFNPYTVSHSASGLAGGSASIPASISASIPVNPG